MNGLSPDGEGKMTFKSLGTSYEGSFVDGKISGYGTYHSKLLGDMSGVWSYVYDRQINTYWKYTGMMKDGVLCGYGVIEDSNSENPRTIYGEFTYDELDGQIKVIQENGYTYSSEVRDGEFKEYNTIFVYMEDKNGD